MVAQGGLGQAGDDGRLGLHLRRQRPQDTGRGVHHAEAVFHGDGLLAALLHVHLGTAQAGQDQRLATGHQVAAVELGGDMHGQVALTQRPVGARRVRGRLGEIAAEADEHLGLALLHGGDGLHGVVTTIARRLEGEAPGQGVAEPGRGLLVDAHGAVALDVAVAAHRAEAGAGPADVAAEQLQVGDLLHRGHRMAVLGDAHGPADDDLLGAGIHARGLFDLVQRQARLALDQLPGGGVDLGQVVVHAQGVGGDEVVVEDALGALGRGFALPLQEVLGDAAQRRHVTAQGRAEVGGVGRPRVVGKHLQRTLRMLEALQAPLLERVEADHLGAALHRVAQGLDHARVVGAGVLADHEDGIRLVQVVIGHGALADADAAAQADATGLVAHVRAVGEVVGAIGAHEQLIEEGRLVAGAPRGIELGFVGAGQGLELLGDQREGGVPGDGHIAIGGRVIAQRLGQPALVFEPVVALLQQRGHAVASEESGIDAAFGGFPVDRLGAVLAKLHQAVFRGLAPGAAGAVEAMVLVGLEQGTQILEGVAAVEPEVHHALQGAPAGGGALIGFEGLLRFVHGDSRGIKGPPAPGHIPAAATGVADGSD